MPTPRTPGTGENPKKLSPSVRRTRAKAAARAAELEEESKKAALTAKGMSDKPIMPIGTTLPGATMMRASSGGQSSGGPGVSTQTGPSGTTKKKRPSLLRDRSTAPQGPPEQQEPSSQELSEEGVTARNAWKIDF
jgi:hypothetical protein